MQIQKLRLERGWSQEHLAQTAGLSVRTVQRLERGRPGSLETLNAIAAAYDLDIGSLKDPEIGTELAPSRTSSWALAATILMLLSVGLALLLPAASIFCATTGVLAASVSILRGRDRVLAYAALVPSVLSLWFVLYTQVPLGGEISERVTRATAQMERERQADHP